MIFADPGHLLLHELFGRGDAGLDLPRVVERGNPPAIEFEGLPSRWFPIGDSLVDLRIDRDRVPALALQIQNAAELRQQLHIREESSATPTVRVISRDTRASCSASA